jgi:hypothetical protein
MTVVLLMAGLLATAAGFVAIGFGIPINAFSLGNTLIVAGTVGVAAGLILIGMAAMLGQLRRIAAALGTQGASRAGRHEAAEATAAARVTPMPAPVPARMPPKPPAAHQPAAAHQPPTPEPEMPEPRFSEPAASGPPAPLDWLRAKPKTAVQPSGGAPHSAEPPMVEVTDEAPLSPRTPHRPSPPAGAEPTFEPRAWSQSRGPASETRTPQRPEQPMPRATPQAPPPKDRDDFNQVWPDRAPMFPEPAHHERAPEMPPSRLRENRPLDRRSDVSPKPAAERAPAILKSGVIDGMPYTLYADGSIEAELPQGTVKFASVDALRAHLENQG